MLNDPGYKCFFKSNIVAKSGTFTFPEFDNLLSFLKKNFIQTVCII